LPAKAQNRKNQKRGHQQNSSHSIPLGRIKRLGFAARRSFSRYRSSRRVSPFPA
jgi:hypothetical protein